MDNGKDKTRNFSAISMIARFANTGTKMRHKNERRAKDARKSWKKEIY